MESCLSWAFISLHKTVPGLKRVSRTISWLIGLLSLPECEWCCCIMYRQCVLIWHISALYQHPMNYVTIQVWSLDICLMNDTFKFFLIHQFQVFTYLKYKSCSMFLWFLKQHNQKQIYQLFKNDCVLFFYLFSLKVLLAHGLHLTHFLSSYSQSTDKFKVLCIFSNSSFPPSFLMLSCLLGCINIHHLYI